MTERDNKSRRKYSKLRSARPAFACPTLRCAPSACSRRRLLARAALAGYGQCFKGLAPLEPPPICSGGYRVVQLNSARSVTLFAPPLATACTLMQAKSPPSLLPTPPRPPANAGPSTTLHLLTSTRPTRTINKPLNSARQSLWVAALLGRCNSAFKAAIFLSIRLYCVTDFLGYCYEI